MYTEQLPAPAQLVQPLTAHTVLTVSVADDLVSDASGLSTSDGNAAASYDGVLPANCSYHKASWQHIIQAYKYQQEHQQSAKGAHLLSMAAVHLNNRSKMSESLCNALLTSRVSMLIEQAYDSLLGSSAELPMTNPAGTKILIEDLSFMNMTFLERTRLYSSPDDTRLVRLQGLLRKWEMMSALNAAHFNTVSAVQLKKYFFSSENMRELKCLVSSFRGFLQQFRARGACRDGTDLLPFNTGIRMPSQNRYAAQLSLLCDVFLVMHP
jgi:hypothetical protein